MKHVRLPYLRELNRFELRTPYVDNSRVVVVTLRPRGFNTRLVNARLEFTDDGMAADVLKFFRAVSALTDTPAPPAQKRRRHK